ncbi:MAG: aminoglycoside phosphotransferase family protein, partial [Candidatus Levyibacteriota bacterium]
MTNNFSKHIIAMHGEKGKDWLEHIPRIIIALEKKWSLHVLDPFPLYYNYVAPVKQEDGTDAVVKIGFPQDKEFFSEIEALRIFNGNGSVQLLKEDKENTAILLERIVSGNTLRS